MAEQAVAQKPEEKAAVVVSATIILDDRGRFDGLALEAQDDAGRKMLEDLSDGVVPGLEYGGAGRVFFPIAGGDGAYFLKAR